MTIAARVTRKRQWRGPTLLTIAVTAHVTIARYRATGGQGGIALSSVTEARRLRPAVTLQTSSLRAALDPGVVPELLSGRQLALAERADLLGAELARIAAEAGGDSGGIEPSIRRTALRDAVRSASQAAGVFNMNQPAAFGGTEACAVDLAIVREALGRHNVGHLPGVFGPSPGLLEHAAEPLRSEVLPALLRGELSGGFGFTEPADAPRHTWAVRDGDQLVVNGQKSYVTGGADADFINTLVEVDGEGPAMVLIFTDTPGVELIRRFGTLDGSHHAAFTFTDVRVPATNVLGAPASGLRRALGQVSAVRMAIAANCVGQCAFVAEQLADHVRRTEQRSGEPAERLRTTLGHARIGTYAARSTLYRTARLVDSHPDDARESANEVMAAKVVATETLWRLTDAAIGAIGGAALADDHPLSGVLRRTRAVRLAEGPSDVLASNVARGNLDLNAGTL